MDSEILYQSKCSYWGGEKYKSLFDSMIQATLTCNLQ